MFSRFSKFHDTELFFLMNLYLFSGQLEKHRRADQELKKRIMKLEFCLQEARTQTRKLQRVILLFTATLMKLYLISETYLFSSRILNLIC